MDAMKVVKSRDKETEAANLAAETLLQIARGGCNRIPLAQWRTRGPRSRQITMAGLLFAKREAELAASSPTSPFVWSSGDDDSATAAAGVVTSPRPKAKSKGAVAGEEQELFSSPSAAVPSPPTRRKKKRTIGELNGAMASLLSENEELKKGVEETRNRLQELRTENKRVKGLLAAYEKGVKEEETERETMDRAPEETTKEKEVEHKRERRCFLLPDLNLPPPEEDQPEIFQGMN